MSGWRSGCGGRIRVQPRSSRLIASEQGHGNKQQNDAVTSHIAIRVNLAVGKCGRMILEGIIRTLRTPVLI
jgi:hypothetical protein